MRRARVIALQIETYIYIYIYTRLNPPIYIGVKSRTAVGLNRRAVEHKSKRHVSAKSRLILS